MSDFYITLPSNVNTSDRTNHFSVNLPKKLELDGQWEVALSEIQYPFSWNNVSGALQPDDTTDNWIDVIFQTGHQATLFVPPGYYDNVETLIKGIEFGRSKMKKSLKRSYSENAKIKKLNPKKFSKLKTIVPFNIEKDADAFIFTYNSTLKRMVFKSQPDLIKRVLLSDQLRYMMGYDTLSLEGKTVWGKYNPDMRNGFYSLYVYCDIVEPQMVGNTIVPLLRTVHIDGKHEDIMEKLYQSPHYVPINKKQIERISIEIHNDRDQLVPFDFGKVLVKLHFRKKRVLI